MRKLAVSLVALVLLAALAGCGEEVPPSGQAGPVDDPAQVSVNSAETPTAEVELAARVNEHPITMQEYEKQLERFRETMVQLARSSDTLEDADMEQVRRQALDWMIDQEVIVQAAAREGFSVSDEELEARVQEIIVQAGGQAEFDQWLIANDLTMEEFRQQLRSELLGQKIRDRVLADLSSQAEQVHARHILVDSGEQAEEILVQLKAGVDFTDLAKERSQDLGSKENGGDLGFFPRGIMLLEFEEAAFALAPGEVSEVVQTSFGFHVIQVLERDPSRQVPGPMLQALRDRAFVQWLREQREAAVIERFVG